MDAHKTAFPHPGRVEWIGLRPARGEPMQAVRLVEATVENGLQGDFFSGAPSAPRQVTLIQSEHLGVIGSLLRRPAIDPALLRRNIVVSGINLQALTGRSFRLGSATLNATGNCAPCHQMEDALGEGGFNAMRSHGGITAAVIEGGLIEIGSELVLLP